MANFVFNYSKGRVVEFYYRVDNNDPGTSAFTVIPLETTGLETQTNLEDAVSVVEVLDGATNEQVSNMTRKTLGDTELAAWAVPPNPDLTNNRFDLDLPDITWTGATGNAISALVIAYNPTAGADSTLIPMTHHDFVVTPDGSDIVATTTLFFRAT